MKVAIDTNVLLDALMGREPWVDAAERVFVGSASDAFVGCLTANSVTDVYYLLRKHLRNKKKAKEETLKLFDVFSVIDVTAFDCATAFELPMLDYEDALLSQCAKRADADFVITRDEKDFAHSPVPAISPTDFLAKFDLRASVNL